MSESLESACRALLEAVSIGEGKVLCPPVLEEPLRRIVAAMMAAQAPERVLVLVEQHLLDLDRASVNYLNRGIASVQWRLKEGDRGYPGPVRLHGIDGPINLVSAPPQLTLALERRLRG